MFAKKLLVLSIVVTLSVAQQPDVQQVNQNDDSSTPSTFVDLILCPFQNEPIKCAGRYAGRMLNGFSKQLTEARKNILVEADRDVEKNLQARGYSVSDFRGQKPSAIMKVIENSVEGVTALVGDAIAEILAPEKSLEKQDTDIGDLIEDDDGSDEGTEFDHGRENGELRGKKKKKKKALMKLLILGAVLKAKIELILKLIATKLQIKFLIIAGIGLLINVARFWIDLKKKHEPQKVIYYEHAQHQHHYEDDDKWGGYWKRSLDVLNKPVAVKNGNIVDYFDVNEGVIDTRSHSNYRNSDYDSHSLAYKNHRPY